MEGVDKEELSKINSEVRSKNDFLWYEVNERKLQPLKSEVALSEAFGLFWIPKWGTSTSYIPHN